MLHKVKHTFSVVLACLFLYPLVYQSIHVFEHSQESDCCTHCTGFSEPLKVSDDTVVVDNLDETHHECSICNFHYAKLQLSRAAKFIINAERYDAACAVSYPKPFVLFAGYIKSLRAPPSFPFLSC